MRARSCRQPWRLSVGKGYCATLTLTLPPQRANSRLHWAQLKRLEDRWAKRAIVTLANSRKRPTAPLERFTLHCIVYAKGRAMDRDGATARLKRAIDLLCGSPKNVKGVGIVHRTPRWLAGDSPEHMVGLTVESSRDWDNPRLEIHVDEVL